jgi:hypothetical protein
VRAGYDGLTRLDGAERDGFFGEDRSGGAVDGPRHTPTGRELRVRRVDHGVDVLLGSYVSLDALDPHGTKFSSHASSQE